MSAAPMGIGDDNDGTKTVAARSLPKSSTKIVSATVGKDYFKKYEEPHWFWFGAQCGLVMSAVSSCEVQTKEKGVHASRATSAGIAEASGHIQRLADAGWTSLMGSVDRRWCSMHRRTLFSTSGPRSGSSFTSALSHIRHQETCLLLLTFLQITV